MTNKLSKNFQQPIEALLSPDVLQAHEERMERVLVQHLKEHGMQFLSCSRQEVAAHEAGHCITLKSTGGTPTSVTISRAQKKTKRVPYEFWIGLTDVDQSHGVAVGPNENINQLKLMTINTLAGIVAEAEIAGRIIPSSSLDEQSIATIYAGWIGQRSDRSTQDVLEELTGRTRNVLRLNKSIARSIAERLNDQDVLTMIELEEMLAGVHTWPIQDLGVLQFEERKSEVA